MPICDCHGVEMRWAKDKRMTAGGYWKCKIKIKESYDRWRKSEKGKAARREADLRYKKSSKGRATQSLWQKTPKGKAAHARYAKSPKGKATKARYEKTDKGIITTKRKHKKYKDSPHGYVTNRKRVLRDLRVKYLIQLEELHKCQIS